MLLIVLWDDERTEQNNFTHETGALSYILIGNTMVLKPSEKVPFTMTKVVELLKVAGLPDGVVNLVNGTAESKDSIGLKRWSRRLLNHP